MSHKLSSLTLVANYLAVGVLIVLVVCCSDRIEENALFQLMESDQTGVYFQNRIDTNDSINLMSYEYLYNGGGVGIGHFDCDSLPDIFFTGNQEEGRLYLNKGAFKFQDITTSSGIDTKGKWCTGVSVVDINADGLDDLYISVGGMGNKNDFPNLLYINQGDNTFQEEATQYGLADNGESIQSVFFDYDLDGDLDMYLLTGGGFEFSAINARPMLINGSGRNTDRLYRNDLNIETGKPFYTNVSKEAGITIEGFGLGVSVFDINNDTYPDIYVSNDYLSKDLMYLNNQDGTFSEKGFEYFGHMSHFSMGNDVADIDNDGFLDVITMDMLPENHRRRQLMSGASSYDFFQMALGFGYGHQHMRNMLHKNNGAAQFSEIGQLSGIANTDWSWAPLFADFDNDGFNDLFITNGYGKDITDLDFVKYRENSSAAHNDFEDLRKSVVDCLQYRPAINIENYVYKNNGDLTFTKKIKDWGFDLKSISNGAAYSDLDLDGDLDLVINNINKPAFIYKNKLRESKPNRANYLKINLIGSEKNKKGFGATVSVYAKNKKQIKFNQPVRGFQSTVDGTLHYGINAIQNIDSVVVMWPDGKKSVAQNINANQTLVLDYATAELFNDKTKITNQLFKKDTIFKYVHHERPFNDYAVQPLLTHGFSNQGPGLAVGDANFDGIQDVFVGGSYGFKSTLMLQNVNGEFDKLELKDSEMYEDLGALFFDANGDGFQDIYVVSGGSERYKGHNAYQDRLYINRVKETGDFEIVDLPLMNTSTSTVIGGDYDQDGDIDLFVGGRMVPGSYPEAPQSFILENQSGKFIDVTKKVSPPLANLGMVSSAVWTDYNNDNQLDLVVVGEYMPITMFKGDGGRLVYDSNISGLEHSSGLWNSIITGDFDNDGDTDFVIGNLGLNTNLTATKEYPLNLNYSDFDQNGFVDPILSIYEEGEYYPLATLDDLTKQLPIVKKKILYYNTYANATTKEILDLFEGINYSTLQAENLASSFIENLGNSSFKINKLPVEAQFAPVNGILAEDLNTDGLLDLILVGNNYSSEVVYGRYDASVGTVLLNQGNNKFKPEKPIHSGFSVIGDARSIICLETAHGNSLVLVGKNNAAVDSFFIENSATESLNPAQGESFAVVVFEDGTQRKIEFNFGGGYLSQTSNSIRITPTMQSIAFFGSSGIKTRTINLKSNI